MITVEARTDAMGWDEALVFRARSLDSGVRTAARRLGLRGEVLTCERVGREQWIVNVSGRTMHVVAKGG